MEWMVANEPGKTYLLQGNEATRGALEAGIRFAASYQITCFGNHGYARTCSW